MSKGPRHELARVSRRTYTTAVSDPGQQAVKAAKSSATLPVNAAHPHRPTVINRTAIIDWTTVNDAAAIGAAAKVLSVGSVHRKIRVVNIRRLKRWVECRLSRLGFACRKGGYGGQTYSVLPIHKYLIHFS